MIASGFLVVANPFSRNPVASALFLVLAMISMAGLFVLLHAYFLAAVQILVYAGAVMVLFLFVIMLLDLKEEEKRRYKLYSIITGAAGAGGLVVILVKTIMLDRTPAPVQAATVEGPASSLGRLLFDPNQPFLAGMEAVSVILLAAMVGVVWLSKKDFK